jgi:hypothetical protein
VLQNVFPSQSTKLTLSLPNVTTDLPSHSHYREYTRVTTSRTPVGTHTPISTHVSSTAPCGSVVAHPSHPRPVHASMLQRSRPRTSTWATIGYILPNERHDLCTYDIPHHTLVGLQGVYLQSAEGGRPSQESEHPSGGNCAGGGQEGWQTRGRVRRDFLRSYRVDGAAYHGIVAVV